MRKNSTIEPEVHDLYLFYVVLHEPDIDIRYSIRFCCSFEQSRRALFAFDAFPLPLTASEPPNQRCVGYFELV